MHSKLNKKAAIELSIGTIVIIVLSMSMLILGLVLIQKIFKGAGEVTDLANQNMVDKINKLFNDEEKRAVVYLPDSQAEIKKGQSYRIGFAIRNANQGGTGEAQKFNYEFIVPEGAGAGVQEGCSLSADKASKFIQVGRSGSVSLKPGDPATERSIVIGTPDDSPLCTILYEFRVWTAAGSRANPDYHTETFIIKVTG